MKVLIVSADCAPNPGGVASHVYNLSRQLFLSGVDVTVVGGYGRPEYLDSFVPPFPQFHVKANTIVPGLPGLSFALWARYQIHEIMRKKRIDIVHIHTLSSDGYASCFLPYAVSRVLTNHSSGFLDDEEGGKRRFFYRTLFRNYDAVIAPSRELAQKSTYLGVSPSRIHYIPNGVDTERFAPAVSDCRPAAEIPGCASSGPIVLATRRLEYKNGVHFLIQAWKRVVATKADAVLAIAGDGPEREALHGLVSRLSLQRQVIFLGNVSNTYLPGLYNAATLCILPSLKEATSISGLEAMACGKPLVGTEVGGIPEIISNNRNGLLVPPGNPEALSDAIIELLNKPELAASFGRQARNRVLEQFSWVRISEATIAVYERCLSERH